MKLAKATEYAIKMIRQLLVPKTYLDLLQVPTWSSCAPLGLPDTSGSGNTNPGYAAKIVVSRSS